MTDKKESVKVKSTAISECTNSVFRIEEGKETIDMCQALQDIRREATEMGRREGRQEGMLEMIGRLVLQGRLSSKEAAEECRLLGYSADDLKRMMESIRKG